MSVKYDTEMTINTKTNWYPRRTQLNPPWTYGSGVMSLDNPFIRERKTVVTNNFIPPLLASGCKYHQRHERVPFGTPWIHDVLPVLDAWSLDDKPDVRSKDHIDIADIAEMFPLYDLLNQSEWVPYAFGHERVWVYDYTCHAHADKIAPYLVRWFNRDDAVDVKLFGDVRNVVERYDLPAPCDVERMLIRAMLRELRQRKNVLRHHARNDGNIMKRYRSGMSYMKPSRSYWREDHAQGDVRCLLNDISRELLSIQKSRKL